MNYPDSKGKKKQKKKPIKKLPNSNPSTLIEPIQQQVAFSARRSTMSSGRSNLSMSSRRSNLSTIGEQDLNRNQNNNSPGRGTQNLGMHTIVEEDIERILRGNGNDLLEPIPRWQNSALVREIAELTQPQGDVTAIPIENDTDTVTNSNRTHSITRSERSDRENDCCYGILFFSAIFSMFVGMLMLFGYMSMDHSKQVSELPKVLNSTNDLWADDYDSHYDIAPQKVC